MSIRYGASSRSVEADTGFMLTRQELFAVCGELTLDMQRIPFVTGKIQLVDKLAEPAAAR